jgi:hypothetical protein
VTQQLEIEDFDTAKAVFEKLKDVPPDRRKRILTWVAEGLGVVLQAGPAPVASAGVTPHSPWTPAALPGHSPQGNAKNLGYLDGTSPGEFSINTVGENLVAMTLPGTAGGAAKVKRIKRPKKKPMPRLRLR